MNKLEKIKIEKIIKQVQSTVPQFNNPLKVFDSLTDEEIDLIVSITSRGDGKSYGGLRMLLNLGIHTKGKACYIVAHSTLRISYVSLIQIVMTECPEFDIKKFMPVRKDDYLELFYGKDLIGIITDLNNASDLKFYSNYLSQFPFMFYDEFLKLEGDYVEDEAEKLQIIHDSIDRRFKERAGIKTKLILFGNPVNWSSPLLAAFDLFNAIEQQEVNETKKHGNVILEIRENKEVNAEKNTSMFARTSDMATKGTFKINRFALFPYSQIGDLTYVGTVKLHKYYVNLYEFNKQIVLSVSQFADNYQLCLNLTDVTDSSPLLPEKFQGGRAKKLFSNFYYKFENSFSLDFIDKHGTYQDINFAKVFAYLQNRNKKAESLELEEQDKEVNYLERSKRSLFIKFFNFYTQ